MAMTAQQAERQMSAEDLAALRAAGDKYNKATTQAEKDAAHAEAEAIRDRYSYSGGATGAEYIEKPRGAKDYTTPKNNTPAVADSGTNGNASPREYGPGDQVYDPYSRKWVVPPKGSTTTTVHRADGTPVQAYILNGRTVDVNGNGFQFQNGDIVETNGGNYQWNNGAAAPYTGALPTYDSAGSHYYEGGPTDHLQYYYDNFPDVQSQLKMFDKDYQQVADYLKKANRAATDQSIAELQAQLENGLTDYDVQRAQAAITQARAASDAALRNIMAGDMGGIGQKQYSSEMNAYDQQMLSIQLEQINFQNSINQQITQLEAEGRYNEAKLLAEWGQARIDALQQQYNWAYEMMYKNSYDLDYLNRTKEADAWERDQAEQNRAWEQAYTRLSLGIFTKEDAEALGMPEDQAQKFADRINLEAQISLDAAQAELDAYRKKNGLGSGSGSGGTGGTGGTYYDTGAGTGDGTVYDTGADTGDGSGDAGYIPGLTDSEYNQFQQDAQGSGVPIYGASGNLKGRIIYSNGTLQTGPLGSNTNDYIVLGGKKFYYDPKANGFSTSPSPSSSSGPDLMSKFRTVTGVSTITNPEDAYIYLQRRLGTLQSEMEVQKRRLESAYMSKVQGLEMETGAYEKVNALYQRLNKEATQIKNLLDEWK